MGFHHRKSARGAERTLGLLKLEKKRKHRRDMKPSENQRRIKKDVKVAEQFAERRLLKAISKTLPEDIRMCIWSYISGSFPLRMILFQQRSGKIPFILHGLPTAHLFIICHGKWGGNLAINYLQSHNNRVKHLVIDAIWSVLNCYFYERSNIYRLGVSPYYVTNVAPMLRTVLYFFKRMHNVVISP